MIGQSKEKGMRTKMEESRQQKRWSASKKAGVLSELAPKEWTHC